MAGNRLQIKMFFVVGKCVIPVRPDEKVASFLRRLAARFSMDEDDLSLWHSGERLGAKTDLESFDGNPLAISGIALHEFTIRHIHHLPPRIFVITPSIREKLRSRSPAGSPPE
jgi:hypothetical protein